VNAPEALTGVWDRTRLEQVVTNLVTNAARYGHGKPIDITVAADARSVRLVVRDHGIGIAPEDQRRIFERFERAASRNFGGLGLGLYIARQIVEAHGGSIHVSSELGVGSSFTVELPRDVH
jgi:signal transduction histidine kinase